MVIVSTSDGSWQCGQFMVQDLLDSAPEYGSDFAREPRAGNPGRLYLNKRFDGVCQVLTDGCQIACRSRLGTDRQSAHETSPAWRKVPGSAMLAVDDLEHAMWRIIVASDPRVVAIVILELKESIVFGSWIRDACLRRPASESCIPLADIGPAPGPFWSTSGEKPFDLAKLRGKVVLVSFVYTTCNGVCPLTTQALVRVQKELEEAKLWGKSVEFVSITLDPKRDTAQVLRDYAQASEPIRPPGTS